MNVRTYHDMLKREREGRHAFTLGRDGFVATKQSYREGYSVYLSAAAKAYEKGNREWGLRWARASKCALKIYDEMECLK